MDYAIQVGLGLLVLVGTALGTIAMYGLQETARNARRQHWPETQDDPRLGLARDE